MAHLSIENNDVVFKSGNNAFQLHPLWLRERGTGANDFDQISHQRLYEHAELPTDLQILSAKEQSTGLIEMVFSDGHCSVLNTVQIEHELGWAINPEAPPTPSSWRNSTHIHTEFTWDKLDTPAYMKTVLERFFKSGFVVIQDTPTKKDTLKSLARRFGYLRETNFGELFNVEMKPDPSDLAYTDVALASHTDNPYRDPVPGIQFLHCIENQVSGGLSTLVDGMAIAEKLAQEAPEQLRVLENVKVRFRYQGPSAILEHHGPIVERDVHENIDWIRLSSRVDYVPALDSATLELFYSGRRRLHQLAASSDYQISFPFKSGTLLMMNNRRLLHGRTAFSGAQGSRYLQGCYIDHDGPNALYRMLINDGLTTSVKREC